MDIQLLWRTTFVKVCVLCHVCKYVHTKKLVAKKFVANFARDVFQELIVALNQFIVEINS